ncbi:hypothetical protein CO037_00025 [Candidatus Pacearchaeota archaeon CG_4_9_14_0_2_um_filter_30_8]|nr:MAG: hypothetical protein CO037_00025 [Candidatus Pacearchaeota archaeon CG_4_9_14_0_2_um_filter_30_8]
MNFKIDWMKLIFSLAIGLLIGLFYANSKMVFGGYVGIWHSFFPVFVAASVISYIVWNLFDK